MKLRQFVELEIRKARRAAEIVMQNGDEKGHARYQRRAFLLRELLSEFDRTVSRKTLNAQR